MNALATKRVGFIQALREYVTRTFDYKGRSTRAAYWWAQLFVMVISFVVAIISLLSLGNGSITVDKDFSQTLLLKLWPIWVLALLLLLPSFSLLIRRYRDAGVAVWIAVVITAIGWLNGLLVIFVSDGAQKFLGLSLLVSVLGIVSFIVSVMPSFDAPKDLTASSGKVGLGHAYKLFWTQYADFSGRSSRSAYWWAYLWNTVIYVAGLIVIILTLGSSFAVITNRGFPDGSQSSSLSLGLPIIISGVAIGLMVLYVIAIFLPSLAITVRRYRDAGVSPWWLLPIYGGSSVLSGLLGGQVANDWQVAFSVIILVLVIINLVILVRRSK